MAGIGLLGRLTKKRMGRRREEITKLLDTRIGRKSSDATGTLSTP